MFRPFAISNVRRSFDQFLGPEREETMTEHVLGTLFSLRVSTRMYVRAAIGCIIAYPLWSFIFHDDRTSSIIMITTCQPWYTQVNSSGEDMRWSRKVCGRNRHKQGSQHRRGHETGQRRKHADRADAHKAGSTAVTPCQLAPRQVSARVDHLGQHGRVAGQALQTRSWLDIFSCN